MIPAALAGLLLLLPSPADSAAADSTAADSTVVAADSAAADSAAAVPPFVPDPAWEALTWFRPERSADVETVIFGGDRATAATSPGIVSLAGYLRLLPGVRTREMSQGPTAESFDLSGAGAGLSALLRPGSSLSLPGTSGPRTHEVTLGELDGFSVVRGGAAALYGPEAADGAVLALSRQPLPDELATRASVEEGVDDWQRGAFDAARRFGSSAALYLATESRHIEGFYPGTKEVDRMLAARLLGRLGERTQGRLEYRVFDGDGRMGGFERDTIRSVLTKRHDLHAELFRTTRAGGALAEANLVREKLETGIGGAEATTRNFLVPSLRITADVPAPSGFTATARLEGERSRIERQEAGETEHRLGGAAALRVTRGTARTFATATARIDASEGRPLEPQIRLEAEAPTGGATWFAILSRGARLPDPEAVLPDDPEILLGAEAGVRVATGPFRWRVAASATDVEDLRREPTFEEIRAREAVLDAPAGDAEIRSASAGFETDLFPFPGLPGLGSLRLRSGVSALSARNVTTDTRLPRRPAFSWTGEGSLERRFFSDQLLARLRGRLAHEHDRIDDTGAAVVDAWVTDVLLEGEVGDAVFFYRFLDMLERADELEPGIRLPGFSRTWGLSWRFTG